MENKVYYSTVYEIMMLQCKYSHYKEYVNYVGGWDKKHTSLYSILIFSPYKMVADNGTKVCGIEILKLPVSTSRGIH